MERSWPFSGQLIKPTFFGIYSKEQHCASAWVVDETSDPNDMIVDSSSQ